MNTTNINIDIVNIKSIANINIDIFAHKCQQTCMNVIASNWITSKLCFNYSENFSCHYYYSFKRVKKGLFRRIGIL